MNRLAIIALCLVCGCQPRAIVYAPPQDGDISVVVRHTPDLNGALKLETSAGTASAAVIAYRKPFYYAVTAKHVVDAADWLLADGQAATTYIMSIGRDVAIVRFKSFKTYSVYPLGRPELGQPCWVVGWPWPGRIVNRGWISRIDGAAVWHNAGGANGCSGGPVLSSKGELLGIVTAYLVELDHGWVLPSRNVYNSLGHAVSSAEIERLMLLIPDE